MLKLNKDRFATFTFDETDWRLLDRKKGLRDSKFNGTYFDLWADYVVENIGWVNELSEFSTKLNLMALKADTDGIALAISDLGPEASQSLFTMKAVAALRVHQPDEVGVFFSGRLKSGWLRNIFVDGLISSTATTIPDRSFQDTTDFMLSNLRHRSEREVIRFMLRPQLSRESTAFRAYVALLSHPFDALQLLTLELERCWSQRVAVPQSVVSKLQHLDGLKNNEFKRLSLALDLLEGDQKKINSTGSQDPAIQYVEHFAREEIVEIPKHLAASGVLAEAIKHCRVEKYPNPEKWEVLRAFSIHWGFSDLGRVVRSFMNSLYLFPRSDLEQEMRSLLPLVDAKGRIDAFVASGPRGMHFVRLVVSPRDWTKTRASIDAVIDAPQHYDCRFRLNAAHWELQGFELEAAPRSWIRYVRENIPIVPGYLSGIEWSWLDAVNSKYRLSHFEKIEMDRYSYVFAHLVMMVEEDNADPVPIRSMLKKIDVSDWEELVEKVSSNLGNQVLGALLRYFLTPSEILHLKLAKNPFAAITVKLALLDSYKTKFGFNSIVDSEYYQTESTTLQRALFARHISRGQFEFSWPRLLTDASRNYQDYYDAALELIRSGEGRRVLGDALVTLEHSFGNKQAASYRLPNHVRQFATVVLAIIDEILQHPVGGLEAILSSRFRHDTLEREFRKQATEIARAPNARLPKQASEALQKLYWPQISQILSDWISSRLQSHRRSTPHGMFNLVPTPDEIASLVDQGIRLHQFTEVFELVQEWVTERLDQQLVRVRRSFVTDLKTELIEKIDEMRNAPAPNEYYGEKRAYLDRLAAGMEHAISETQGWFTIPERAVENTFTIDVPIEIAKQVCGVETNEISALSNASANFPSDMRKPALYTCVDIVANAQKHGEVSRLRVSRIADNLVFSNFVCSQSDETWEKTSLAKNQAQLFSEGDSGLIKISAGMSALCGKPVKVRAVRRKRWFHLVIPASEIIPCVSE
ncbi:hypothetical protein [Roseovarius sp. A-2]|uniref:hypothetical protein n=1 Tax=Roseovarius sp. A-2 TaxID=1570360 RepID=UPI00111AC354|nr:hypothetical protein [Roseovarius sp. A-2]